jgi:hypothetical protein
MNGKTAREEEQANGAATQIISPQLGCSVLCDSSVGESSATDREQLTKATLPRGPRGAADERITIALQQWESG